MENLQLMFVKKILLFNLKILSNNIAEIVINKTEKTTNVSFIKTMLWVFRDNERTTNQSYTKIHYFLVNFPKIRLQPYKKVIG